MYLEGVAWVEFVTTQKNTGTDLFQYVPYSHTNREKAITKGAYNCHTI